MIDGADREFRNLLAKVLEDCREAIPRNIVLSEMANTLGRPPLKSLNDFTSCKENGGARFPACWIKTISETLHDDRLARALLPERLELFVAVGEAIVNSRKSFDEVQKMLAAAREKLVKLEQRGLNKARKPARY